MFSKDELDQARAVPVLELAGAKLKKEGRTRVGPCPICGGGDDRFIVWPAENRWYCRQCPEGENRGDSIDLEMRLTGRSFIDVVRERIGEEAGTPAPRRPTPEQIEARQKAEERRRREEAAAAAEAARKNQRAAEIIAGLRPVADSPGATYLRDVRLIDTRHWAVRMALESVEALGWNDRVYVNQPDPTEPLHTFHGQYLPAIVAILTDPINGARIGGITRTYLHHGLKIGKAMSLGGAGRLGIVRLSPDDEVLLGLHLCEGIETALSGMSDPRMNFCPMWAAGSTTQLAKFPVLPGVECLTILADNDDNEASVDAASTAYWRWKDAGRDVRIRQPKERGDLNDVIKRGAK
jgi:hypothetical protein